MSDWTNQLAALLQQGQQFGQGMSNAAAGTVSAPVDGISWLLRKAGMGNVIGNAPVGGSDWMAQQGLTRPTNGLAGLAGEAVGGVAPMLAAARAPQIGNALMRMGENAAAPTSAANLQRGAIVYHGSPHTFDSFDMGKIGTGEGAQAYGQGLYFADAPEVAKNYQTVLSRPSSAGLSKADDIAAWAHSSGRGPMEAQEMLSDEIARLEQYGKFGKTQKRSDYEEAMGILKNGKAPAGGNLYKVDLPDEHIAKMLDWDKPLSQQPDLQKAVFANGWQHSLYRQNGSKNIGDFTGGELVSSFGNDSHSGALFADDLRKAGIPGIRYLDQGSRAGGVGTSNYVVFDDALPQIVSRNGLNP